MRTKWVTPKWEQKNALRKKKRQQGKPKIKLTYQHLSFATCFSSENASWGMNNWFCLFQCEIPFRSNCKVYRTALCLPYQGVTWWASSKYNHRQASNYSNPKPLDQRTAAPNFSTRLSSHWVKLRAHPSHNPRSQPIASQI